MSRKKVHVAVIGLGYVGLTTTACFARDIYSGYGVKVTGIEVDERKRNMIINNQKAPFYEPGLDKLIDESLKNRHLIIASEINNEAMQWADIIFVCVGTPQLDNGDANLKYVKDALASIRDTFPNDKRYRVIVIKSTVPPTTTLKVALPLLEATGRKCGVDFGLSVCPEFLREGSAVNDTMWPSRIIIGKVDDKGADILKMFFDKVYHRCLPEPIPLYITSATNAEMIKYASNAFLAMKISFINVIADLCERLEGGDVEDVACGIGLDERIGSDFLNAGLGYGGSCFGKDVKAMHYSACSVTISSSILAHTLPVLFDDVLKVNSNQPTIVLSRISDNCLNEKTAALLGLSFKPNTDDVRDAKSLNVALYFTSRGMNIKTYDPVAIDNFKREADKHPFKERIAYATSWEECLKNTDVAVLVTEWAEFKSIKPADFKRLMRTPLVIDGRRLYDKETFRGSGVTYMAVGLNEVVK